MKIHILGICGTFMGGLARILIESGHKVSGSDNNFYPPMSDQLRELVHEQAHIDFENTRKDFGQIGVWEEMSGWDSELFESISKEFNLPEEEDS